MGNRMKSADYLYQEKFVGGYYSLEHKDVPTVMKLTHCCFMVAKHDYHERTSERAVAFFHDYSSAQEMAQSHSVAEAEIEEVYRGPSTYTLYSLLNDGLNPVLSYQNGVLSYNFEIAGAPETVSVDDCVFGVFADEVGYTYDKKTPPIFLTPIFSDMIGYAQAYSSANHHLYVYPVVLGLGKPICCFYKGENIARKLAVGKIKEEANIPATIKQEPLEILEEALHFFEIIRAGKDVISPNWAEKAKAVVNREDALTGK